MNRQEAKLRIFGTYWKTDNISETAWQWATSRQVVRKWVRRYEEMGNDGIIEHSRRPHHCPTKTTERIEKLVIQARKETGYGRKRLALYLWRTKGRVLHPTDSFLSLRARTFAVCCCMGLLLQCPAPSFRLSDG